MTRFGIILAGGQSRRMGGVDKAGLELGGRRLIDHVITRLTPQVDTVLIAGPDDYGSGLATLPDPEDGPVGPAAGLLAAARHVIAVGATDPALVTVPVDTPFLATDLVHRLCADPLPAVAQSGGRLQPAFSAWRPDTLLALLADLPPGSGPALAALADAAAAHRVDFAVGDAFLNINTVTDLEQARRRLAATPSD
ncbi:molybdenum cofactor guanylyltransferase [Maricaulis maris]|uniref:Molybdenum cofactor guanylyltransferase n=1 Tax=Maricaulis maris TaxID=74318 RepID=A0A495D367_9PROT|nr:NTP transferase domain-containing protein [Maricaulis maris]RKQ96207.1 molybdenum cofactor guanylyltransferase [Maricaulis maris]